MCQLLKQRIKEEHTYLPHCKLFTYQSCVFDGNDKIKERFQSCFVPRRIFLNLKRGNKNKPALESPAPFNSKYFLKSFILHREANPILYEGS